MGFLPQFCSRYKGLNPPAEVGAGVEAHSTIVSEDTGNSGQSEEGCTLTGIGCSGGLKKKKKNETLYLSPSFCYYQGP